MIEKKVEDSFMSIFISYSSLDEKLALEIRKKLDGKGIPSFLAPKDIKGGDLFEEKIRDSLLTCTEVFLLVTPNSLKSEWVISEYGAAWALKKTIIPLLFRCTPEDLPSKLANRQARDFHEIDKVIEEFEERYKTPNMRSPDGILFNLTTKADTKKEASQTSTEQQEGLSKAQTFHEAHPSTLHAKILTLPEHPNGVTSVAFSPNGTLLASESGDGTIRICRTSDGQLVHVLKGDKESGRYGFVTFSPDGNMLASAGFDDTIQVWKVSDGQHLYDLKGHYRYDDYKKPVITDIAYLTDGTILACIGGDSTNVQIWRFSDKELFDMLEIDDIFVDEDILKPVLSPDGTMLTFYSVDPETAVRVHSTLDGQLLHILKGQNMASVSSPVFSLDGTMLASIIVDNDDDTHLYLWRIIDERLLHTLRVPQRSEDDDHNENAYCLAFSPDGTVLASGHYDTIRLWRISDGKLLRNMVGQDGIITSIAFSPDGTLLASGTFKKTVRLWRLE
jgi:WD40 repeat protein